jgi:hemerythrin-like domain-containing protein
MDAIRLLAQEHREIEKALDALYQFSRRLAQGETVDQTHLAQFVSFIRTLADERHHGKEEAILFEVMIKYGFPSEHGPIAVMLGEHDEGRALVGTMDAVARLDVWGPEDRRRAAQAAASFVNLLRQHINKEDFVLYPMAENNLPETARDEIEERCRRFEEEWERKGGMQWDALETVVARYVVAA